MSDQPTRTCTVCGQTYPLTNEHFAITGFGKNAPYHRTVCRSCFTRQQREKRAAGKTRTCKLCGRKYPATQQYFGISYARSGVAYLRHQCITCTNARHNERQRQRRGSVRPPRAAAPDTYRIIAIDWHSMRLLELEAAVVSVIADIATIKSNDDLDNIIRPIWANHPDLLFAKNPTVKALESEGDEC